MKGINNKILKINLTDKSFTIDTPGENFYRKYLGGRGFALYYLHKEMDCGIDPLSDKNILIFATSIIVGAPGPAIPRVSVCAKSPLTGGFGESEAGGFWGPELKKSGFDAVIIKGKADKPLYIWIKDGQVRFKSAEKLWGKDTAQVQDLIRKELRDEKAKVAQTGIAGENMVKYANISNELGHFNGRTGLGAVMGSKNLKAIAVRGTNNVSLADKDKVISISRWAATEGMKNPLAKTLHETGTVAGLKPINEMGALPTKNWNKSQYEEAEKISGETMKNTIGKKPRGCFSCPIRCKRVVEVNEENLKVDSQYGGPEYETVAAFGSLLEIDDLKIIAKANELCNKYTIDTISAGMTIAFAMECYEKQLLNKDDCDGLKLEFGNEEVVLKLLDKIARREGIGDLLAEGSYRAAKKIGQGSEKFVHHVKKQEVPMHDPRVKTGVGLQYALADYGADHMKAVHDSYFANEDSPGTKSCKTLGLYGTVDPRSVNKKKTKLFKTLDIYWTLIDSLGACCFGYEPRGPVPIKMLVELVQAITGVDFSLYELMKSAERNINMGKLFNLREGMTKKADKLPHKFTENLPDGPLKNNGAIDGEKFQNMIYDRYDMMGWDVETGKPKEEKLVDLDLEWLI